MRESHAIINAWPESGRHPLARAVVLALAGSVLIAVCARIQVPMWPVPVTMQSFAVLLIGLALGLRLATATVGLYLAQGALGLPVFAAGGGLAYFAGPTAGYLFGFLAAAALVGHLADRGWSRTLPAALAATLAGTAVIYLLGASWLAAFVGPETAITAGVLPFLLGDALKAALAAVLLPLAWRLIRLFG